MKKIRIILFILLTTLSCKKDNKIKVISIDKNIEGIDMFYKGFEPLFFECTIAKKRVKEVGIERKNIKEKGRSIKLNFDDKILFQYSIIPELNKILKRNEHSYDCDEIRFLCEIKYKEELIWLGLGNNREAIYINDKCYKNNIKLTSLLLELIIMQTSFDNTEKLKNSKYKAKLFDNYIYILESFNTKIEGLTLEEIKERMKDAKFRTSYHEIINTFDRMIIYDAELIDNKTKDQMIRFYTVFKNYIDYEESFNVKTEFKKFIENLNYENVK